MNEQVEEDVDGFSRSTSLLKESGPGYVKLVAKFVYYERTRTRPEINIYDVLLALNSVC